MKNKLLTVQIDEGAALKRIKAFGSTMDEVLALLPPGGKLALADEGAYLDACEILLDVKSEVKVYQEEHESFLEKAKAMLAQVNGWFKPELDKAARVEAIYKEALRAYHVHVEAQIQGLRATAGKLAEKDEDKREELLRRADALAPPKVAGIAFQGAVSVEVWDFEKLPREYKKLVADEKAIKAAVEKGETIPGVRVTDARSVRVTPGNAGRAA